MSDIGVEDQNGAGIGKVAEKLPFEDMPETLRYGDIVLTEARSILQEYLPEALPQEPTEISLDVFPQYVGEYKGTHYIIFERIFFSDKTMKRLDEEIDALRESFENTRREMAKIAEAYKEEAKKGEPDWDSVEQRFAQRERQHTKREPKEREKEDWEEPERISEGRASYSSDTWRCVLTAVHELIHQRQAELYPGTLTHFTPEDLGDVDISKLPKYEKFPLLRKAHRAKVLSMSDEERNSVLYPVIEGSAVLGTYLVMGQLADDIERKGDIDTATKIRGAQRWQLQNELTSERDTQGNPVPDPYKQNYQRGFRLIKKLYRKFGPKKTPEIISGIDLAALRGISERSKEYERMMDDPTKLPGIVRSMSS